MPLNVTVALWFLEVLLKIDARTYPMFLTHQAAGKHTNAHTHIYYTYLYYHHSNEVLIEMDAPINVLDVKFE